VGQRRGLGVAAGRKQYVVRLDVERNVVVLGDDEDLASRELVCRLAWVDTDAVETAADLRAQIRSRHPAEPVTAVDVDGDTARVVFAVAQRAIAPGQTVAVYDGDVVVGSGLIEDSTRAARALP
jgi:tRNA-specific 2-thiouridylase